MILLSPPRSTVDLKDGRIVERRSSLNPDSRLGKLRSILYSRSRQGSLLNLLDFRMLLCPLEEDPSSQELSAEMMQMIRLVDRLIHLYVDAGYQYSMDSKVTVNGEPGIVTRVHEGDADPLDGMAEVWLLSGEIIVPRRELQGR